MIKIPIAVFLFFITVPSYAQPYLDIASFKYLNSPDAGAWRRDKTSNQIQYYNFSLTLPFIRKKDSSIIAFSPFAERWNTKIISMGEFPPYVNSLALPLNLVKSLSQKWGITLVIVPRWNGNRRAIFSNDFQLGGAFLTTWKKRPGLTWKLGIYYNSDLSGPIVWPLLGIDWRINKRNNLFGVLPGSLVFEHKRTQQFYYGAAFKAITNTYTVGAADAVTGSRYLRIDDNQLSLFADFYIASKLVITAEAGHSAFRALRLGMKDAAVKYYYKEKMNDNLLFKISLNYRIRL